MKTVPWTDEETQRACKMRGDGIDTAKIGSILGRTAKAVKARLALIAQTDEQRKKRNAYERARRERDNKTFSRKAGITFEAHKSKIPDAVIAERDSRYRASHQDLTAAFFGDPLPGRSALDRRESA